MHCFFSTRQKIHSLLFAALLFFVCTASVSAQGNTDEDFQKAIRLFNEGQDAHEKNDFNAAIKLYEEALKLFPEFPEAEFQRGSALQSLGKVDEAEAAFRRALALREDWSLPMTNLGIILVEKGFYREAEELLTNAIEFDGINFSAHSALTELRLRTKAGLEILRELLNRVKILTTQARAPASIWASRAALENAIGDRAEAKKSLSRALALDANNKNALLELGEIGLSEGDSAAALQIAEKLKKIAPHSVSVKHFIARALVANGKTTEAIRLLDEIRNPTNEIIELRNKLTATKIETIAELEEQIVKNPKNASALGKLCHQMRVESPSKAVDYCKRALEIEPNNLNHAGGLGAALVQAKQYEQAVNFLRKVLEISPENSTVRANLATALFQLKRYQEAITEFKWLIEKQADLAIAYYFLAICYDSLGKYVDAMANYHLFLKHADAEKNKLEIEKVNLRLPQIQRQIKNKK